MSFSTRTASGKLVSLLNPYDGPIDPALSSADAMQVVESPINEESSAFDPPDNSEVDEAVSTDWTMDEPTAEMEPTLSTEGSVTERTRRKHICTVCQKAFTTSGHLTRHSKTHTGEKTHVCPFPGCDVRCNRSDNLVQHYRVHLPKEERKLGTAHIREALSRMSEMVAEGETQPDSFFHPSTSLFRPVRRRTADGLTSNHRPAPLPQPSMPPRRLTDAVTYTLTSQSPYPYPGAPGSPSLSQTLFEHATPSPSPSPTHDTPSQPHYFTNLVPRGTLRNQEGGHHPISATRFEPPMQ